MIDAVLCRVVELARPARLSLHFVALDSLINVNWIHILLGFLQVCLCSALDPQMLSNCIYRQSENLLAYAAAGGAVNWAIWPSDRDTSRRGS